MKRWQLMILGLMLVPVAPAAESVSFDSDIRPLFNRCMQCHGPSKARGGLRLDSKDAALGTLDSGKKAIIPGKPDESELLHRVSTTEKSERMPPKGDPLTPAQVEKLRRWIAAGANWPAHWAYRPLVRPTLPLSPATMPKDWARTPIDRFILEKLAARKLAPAPEVDRRTLLRRVTFDLTGLPPTPEDVDAFLADNRPDAYERVVDRLLASPAYGERWARHWMDVVHFAETHGHDQDRPRENAWPYRDYLIRAFNADRPYARFVREQVAGDVLFPGDSWATVATGFLATGPWDESSLRDIREDSIDREIGRYLDRDDIVTTVMSTFASTTVHCARCHNHKFDPIKQDEYYALQAVFAATDKANRAYDADSRVAARRHDLAERKARLAKQRATLDRSLLDATRQAEVATWEKEVTRAGQLWQVLDAAEFRSAEGATLKKLPDGSILSGGKRPERDTVTVVAHTKVKGITGIRLEVLTDDSLPHRGPGRQDNGNLHLNEFTVTAAPQLPPPRRGRVGVGGKEPQAPHPHPPPQRGEGVGSSLLARPLTWRSARADFDQQGWTIAHAIDGNPATAWGIFPEVGKPHRAVFTLKEPLRQTGGVTLTFKLQQTHGGGHLIGRFRLSVTDADRPDDAVDMPAAVAAILKVSAAERTNRQRADLAAYYLTEKLDREIAALPPRSLVYCGTSVFTPDGTFAPAK